MDYVELSERLLTEFKYITDRSLLAICIIQQGYLVYHNQQFIELFGYSDEEIQSWKKREFFKVIHPKDQNSFLERLQIIDNKTLKFMVRGIRKDKTIITLDCYLCLICYEQKHAYLVTSMEIVNNTDLNKEKYKFENNLLTENNISLKIETFLKYNLPELYKFYKVKASYNNSTLLEIIIKTLKKEYHFSKNDTFIDAMK